MVIITMESFFFEKTCQNIAGQSTWKAFYHAWREKPFQVSTGLHLTNFSFFVLQKKVLQKKIYIMLDDLNFGAKLSNMLARLAGAL